MLKHILLYGSSIPLTGLAAQLRATADMDVRQQPADAGPLSLAGLDAIIVDFDDAAAADVLSILRARPDLKIVGISAPGNAITVISGQVYLTHTLADVMKCLE